ncbi:uncharacterized protein LOC107267234 [Cephus cinctus]|uniref:Uncharacterized protein LOC107267234 n=1 Tax=Cephus cinctus TaxID=211228 RepID=A0AAJ7BTR8_CEPCN|nr:uncharacterized protein LOC107267234 [Cephus cinctus]
MENTDTRVRFSGRFTTRKKLKKQTDFIASMRETKKRKTEEKCSQSSDLNPCEGRRIVDIQELGKNLVCTSCTECLSLQNVKSEKRLGLNSIFLVKCHRCSVLSDVATGKMHAGGRKRKVSDVNTKTVLGFVHAGVGSTALNKILACLNIPEMTSNMFKRYE